jgi:hypothetical protein
MLAAIALNTALGALSGSRARAEGRARDMRTALTQKDELGCWQWAYFCSPGGSLLLVAGSSTQRIFARPAQAPNGTTYRRVIHPHAMRAFPELAVGFQGAIWVGFQLCDQASFQGRIFLRRMSRNGFGRESSGCSSLCAGSA